MDGKSTQLGSLEILFQQMNSILIPYYGWISITGDINISSIASEVICFISHLLCMSLASPLVTLYRVGHIALNLK